MKRWKAILGRGGTTFIAISLALLLVSIIPEPQLSSSVGSGAVGSNQVQIQFNAANLNPQRQLQVKVSVDGTLQVYLLEANVELQFSPTIGFGYEFNLTDLQEIVNEHPERILWEQKVVDGEYERSYTPTRIVNASVIFYNPTSETALVEHTIALKSSLAPRDKVLTLAYWAAPIGIVLTIPWLAEIRKNRKQAN